MRRLMRGAAVLATVLALGPLQVAAQQGRPGGAPGAPQAPGRMMRPGARWMGGGRGAAVEGIMRMRDRLKLTSDQFKQLDAVRAEIVQRRAAHQDRMLELRSKVMAGEATRGALVDSMTAWRKAATAVRQQQRDRVEAILTQAQKDTLQSLVARRRAFARRAGALRGMRERMWGRGGAFMPGRGGAMWNRGGWGRADGMMPPMGRGMRRGGMGGWMGQRLGPPLPDSARAPDSGGGGQ